MRQFAIAFCIIRRSLALGSHGKRLQPAVRVLPDFRLLQLGTADFVGRRGKARNEAEYRRDCDEDYANPDDLSHDNLDSSWTDANFALAPIRSGTA